MSVTLILDSYAGDSGKGKLAAFLSLHRDIQHVVSGGTGPNGGHEYFGDQGLRIFSRQVPPGFVNKNATLYIGPGTFINYPLLLAELRELGSFDVDRRFFVDYRCGLVPEDAEACEDKMGFHDLGLRWEAGTTAATIKHLMRAGKRIGDVPSSSFNIIDSAEVLNGITMDQEVLVVGTHGPAYSLYSGDSYPIATSADCSAAATLARTGIAWSRLKSVIGVVNMLPVTTLDIPIGSEMSVEEVNERGLSSVGAISGRERRVAKEPVIDTLDKFVHRERPSEFALGRADLFDPAAAGCLKVDGLPASVRDWIHKLEDRYETPVKYVSTGPSLYDTIVL